MRRRWRRWLLPLVGILVISCVAGCKKKDNWGEEIETAPVDVNAMREKAKEKKQGGGQAPPAGNPQGQ